MPETIYKEDEVYLSKESLRETFGATDKAELVYDILKELENNGVDDKFKNTDKIESTLKRFKDELHKFIR